MSPSAWERSRRIKHLVLTVVLLAAGGGVAVLVFLNNRGDVSFSSQKDAVESEQTSRPVKKEQSRFSPDTTDSAPVDTARLYRVDLPGTNCDLADRRDLVVHLSLVLLVADSASREKVLFLRDELRVALQNLFRQTDLDQVLVESLRPRIIEVCNRRLGARRIVDIEFTDFRIDRKKS